MTLSDRLKGEGYQPECAADGPEGLLRATSQSYDLIILDVMLPGKNGFDVCRDIRKTGLTVPIGADDYLTKPFELLELMARIEALLRRGATPGQQPSGVQKFGTIQIDFRGTTVFRDGAVVPLSAREFHLLRYFVQNRGATLSREVLLKDVWGYNEDTFTRTVDVHVGSLRQKLESDPKQPSMIVTVPGLGYKFTA
jgi:DNA-binding response OmpR family regulator